MARRARRTLTMPAVASQKMVWPFLPLPSAEDWALVLAARTAPDGEKVFMLLSHLAFLLPIAFAVWKRLWLLAALTTVGALASLGYHTCVTYDVCAGVDLVAWRNFDYVTAPLMVVATILLVIAARDHLGDTARRAAPAVYLLITIAVVFAQFRYPFSNYVLYVSGVACALLVALTWLLVLRPQRPEKRAGPSLGLMVLSLLLVAGGILAFAWLTDEVWPHALAHVLFALAQALFIVAMRPPGADDDTDDAEAKLV